LPEPDAAAIPLTGALSSWTTLDLPAFTLSHSLFVLAVAPVLCAEEDG